MRRLERRKAGFAHRAYAFLALAVLLIFSSGLFAQPSALERLAGLLRETHSLQADVEQLLLDQEGREMQEIKARMALRKPDHFYWRVSSPYEELMVADGERLWRYEPDLQQATLYPFEEDPQSAPLLLLNGDVQAIGQSYEVSASDLEDGRAHFLLLPLDPGSLFERLSVIFHGPRLEAMHFEDSLGQKTSFSFFNLELNVPLDDSLFEFQAPEGIEIMDFSAE